MLKREITDRNATEYNVMDYFLNYFYNTGNAYGDTLIHAAKKLNLCSHFVFFLFDKFKYYKMDVNNVSYAFINQYITAFPANIVYGELEITSMQFEKMIHEYGFDPTIVNNEKMTVFHCIEFNKWVLDRAIRHKVNINQLENIFNNTIFDGKNYSLETLMAAVKRGFILKEIPYFGKKVSRDEKIAVTKYYISTLSDISKFSSDNIEMDEEATQMLLDKGMSLNEALFKTTRQSTAVRYLIDKGADVKYEKYRYKMIEVFSWNDLKYAIEKGLFDWKTERTDRGGTIFHGIISSLDGIKYLVEIGFDLNTKDNNGATVLHCDGLDITDEIVEYVKANGFDIESKDNEGRDIFDNYYKEINLGLILPGEKWDY